MKLFSRKVKTRAEPLKKTSAAWFYDAGGFEDLVCDGYVRLDQCPEIKTGVETIAALVGSMTIHLMRSTEGGNVRVRDALSRIVDIEPNATMTRIGFISWIVKTMLLYGDGNAVVLPRTEGGELRELIPVPASKVVFRRRSATDYVVRIGDRVYAPHEVLHFTMNPSEDEPWRGTGCRVALSEVAERLKQAGKTAKGFLASKWMPSIIVKVDAMTEEFASREGRRRLLDEYVEGAEAGEPWVIPAEQFGVEQVRPLTLADLAIADVIRLDRESVAAILGVPAFVLGVGDFKRDAWNNFVSTRIMTIAQGIQQVLTRGLVTDEHCFFRFNPRSLYSYDLRDLAAIADEQYVRGIMDGNEVRDWLGLSPREGLSELVLLENYIPIDRIGDQKKLKDKEDT